MTIKNLNPRKPQRALIGCLSRLVRFWRYCFCKRLAVRPLRFSGKGEYPQAYFYEWQKLKNGYRWF